MEHALSQEVENAKISHTVQTGPLVAMREVGRALGLPWSAARMLVVAAGLEVIPGGSPRRWYVRRQPWTQLKKRLRLQRRREAVA